MSSKFAEIIEFWQVWRQQFPPFDKETFCDIVQKTFPFIYPSFSWLLRWESKVLYICVHKFTIFRGHPVKDTTNKVTIASNCSENSGNKTQVLPPSSPRLHASYNTVKCELKWRIYPWRIDASKIYLIVKYTPKIEL